MKLKAKIIQNQSGTPCFQVTYKDKAYRVKMFRFQEGLPDGTEIDCLVTTQANGEYYLRQNLPAILREYYTEGEEYEYEVKHDFTHNGYYELLDERGIPYRLPVPRGLHLLTGSTVRCRLERIDSTGGHLKLVDRDLIVEAAMIEDANRAVRVRTQKVEMNADSLAESVETEYFGDNLPDWDVENLFSLLFVNSDYYARAVDDGLLAMIRQWSAEGVEWEEIYGRLDDMRGAVMYVLEGSTLLLGQEPLRRKSMQHRLSVMADSVSGYRRAARYLSSGESETKTDRVLYSLRTSGFIYEAEKQLDMLRRLFSLSTQFMREKMADVLSIIHTRSEDFWRDEPFRKAFIRLLQLYVEQCRHGIEDSGDIADHPGKSEGEKGENGVRPLLEALAIQLLLADPKRDDDVFDYNLNLAMLYRYAAALRTSVPENAANNAFMALMDVIRSPKLVYTWSDTGAHDLLASKLTVARVGTGTSFCKWYTNRHVQLALSDSGVAITRTDVPRERIKTLELKEVGLWPKLEVMTAQKIAAVSGNADIKRAHTMWQAIERSLFSEEEEVKRPLTRLKGIPQKDDECQIIITGQVDETLFKAEIVNSEGLEGRGLIAVDDIVKYKIPALGMQHFRDDNGNPYVLIAKVKKVEDGVIYFTMYDNMVQYTHDMIDNNREFLCVIKSKNQYGCVGVSEQGDSVRFKEVDESLGVRIGSIVVGNWWHRPERSGEPYIDGAIVEVIEDPEPFSTENAFAQLIKDYSGEEVYIEEGEIKEDDSDNIAGEELLTDSRLTELMAVIERRAAAESDYMKAFNHIGLARLLARIGRDERRREFYGAWMRLISMLHYFAVNGEIDPGLMKEFEENDRSRFDVRSELYRRYLQLKIASYKGRPGKAEELWKLMSDSDEEIRSLASNVMAYNILIENGSASMMGEISDRINNILQVKGRASTLHSFGSENKKTEFKTSIVYPPNNNMRANLDVQTLEVMKELCALLNADGGTLYVGVNDFGMGVGVENDLQFFNGSEDKYDLHVRHSVCRYMGRDVDAYVNGHFETYGEKRIYVIDVKPYYTAPVKVEGIIYERHGSSKLPFINAEDVRLFTDRRALERNRIVSEIAERKGATQTASPEVTEALPEVVAEEESNEEPRVSETNISHEKSAPAENVVKAEEKPEINPEKVATRSGRGVCPASFDENSDPATIRYLQINRDDYMLVPEFYGYDEDNGDLLLTLPLRQEDMKGWLVLGYADGTACRVPVRSIVDKEDYTSGKRYTGAELVFAEILDNDEALLTLSKGKRGTWNARAERIDEIPEVAGIREAGEKLFNTEQEEYRYDVLSGLKKLNYRDLFDRVYRDAGKPFNAFSQDKLYSQLVKDGFFRS